MLSRFRFLALVVCLFFLTLARATPAPAQVNAFGPLKAKLAAGADAVLFINGDSTAYSEHGPYYKFAKVIGEATGRTVVLHRWAEWEVRAPSGPKDYAAPVTIHEGTQPGRLTVYLAALPGGVAADMFSGDRRGKALEAIPRPDCAILHQGHNMRNYPKTADDDLSSIRGMYFAAIGQTSMLWPGVPQVIVTQNPLGDSDKYAGVYHAMLDVARIHPGINLVDTHAAFVAAGKAPALYRGDPVHPSDREVNSAGAQLSADTLLAAWNAAKPGAFTTPGWPERKGVPLVENGDFSEWFGDAPYAWSVELGATVVKSTAVTYGGAPYSAELRPNGSKIASFQKFLSEAELGAVRGKTITIAILVRASAGQPRPYASFVCPVEGKNRTYVASDITRGRESWMWLVCSGIPVDATATRNSCYLRILPAFSLKEPESNEPLYVQRVVIVEGELPAGLLPPPAAK